MNNYKLKITNYEMAMDGLSIVNRKSSNSKLKRRPIVHYFRFTLHAFLFTLSFSGMACYAQEADSVRQTIGLQEVIVGANAIEARQKLQPLTAINRDKAYVQDNRSNSLMNSLEKLPGISAFQVGQGFSKPVIRGLGFNRLVVAEHGIKQQGQQWGADHGLEIDQYDIENVEIIKGPASLQYGAEAIAGVILINTNRWRDHDGLSGSVMLNGNSNNRLFGGSGDIGFQKRNKYIALRATYQNYESFRVPAKEFEYMSSIFHMPKGVLKNTAGRETDVSLHTGIKTKRYSADLSISDVHSKAGFFSGAYGLLSLVNMADEGHYRDVNLPYHEINHFKTIFNQTFKLNKHHKFTADFGYQYNLRQEFSAPHTHGFGPLPQGNLELEMQLQTASGNVAWEYRQGGSVLQAGVNAEVQHNRVDGYFFLLPKFEQVAVGAFAIERYSFSNKLTATVGLRYDRGQVHIHHFDGNIQGQFRIPEMQRYDDNVSFMAGVAYNPNEDWDLKLNAGKSFRIPTVNEFASHGISHTMFREEIGDSSLTSETSYQIDAHIAFKKELDDNFFNRLSIAASGFTNYFPNFIFLNPSGTFSPSPEVGQQYNFVQSRAFRVGGELEVQVDFAERFRWQLSADYVQATDLDSEFPIALTPPMNIINEVSVRFQKLAFLTDNRFAIAYRYTATQDRVARNEDTTPEYHLFDLSVTLGVPVTQRMKIQVVLQVQNIFNTQYYKHLSFYRRLNLPEIGRNFLLSIQVPIS